LALRVGAAIVFEFIVVSVVLAGQARIAPYHPSGLVKTGKMKLNRLPVCEQKSRRQGK